ncbi:MAG: hypothetical protein NT123_05865 [Proteobacteria bacterium]|nr:hypothetical protein [Pseudomonadota bacterium]
MKSFIRTVLSVVFAAMLIVTSGLGLAQKNKSERVAVAANDKTIAASVGSQAGRSPYFLFFDKQGAFVEAVDNPYKNGGNAGIPALEFLAGKGVTILVAEGFGPKIVEVMKSKGMRPVEFKGNAKDAAKKALEPK